MTQVDPTANGLQITSEPDTDTPRDVFDLVRRKLLADESLRGKDLSMDDFIEAARDYYGKNAPIAMDNLSAGLGLRFQDGQSVPFVDADIPQMEGLGSPMASMAHDHAPAGKGRTEPTFSQGVSTGAESK